jgi:Tfp pilus assembly protein PilF
MRKLLQFAVLATLAGTAQGAAAKWIRMPSSDFEIYSSASEGDTRRVLQYFERVRSFFEQSLGAGGQQKREPIRIIVFGSKKEYQEYRPNEIAEAFYTQVAGRDYIVLGSANEAAFPIAVHEYVHLVAQNGGLKLPPWLNEGFAELFSTLKPVGDKILVGGLIPGRMQELLREKWVPLTIIVAAGHDSPYYNEKSQAGSLYNEGWAFTHMLDFSPQYRIHIQALLEEIQKGTPSQKAIEGVYGKPLEDVDKDLQAYLRSDRFTAMIVPAKLQAGEKAAAEPASMFDVKLALLDLANRPGKEAEARSRLQELMSDDPKRPEPYVGLGYLAARSGQQEEALKAFENAVERGSHNSEMLWDYGRMAGRSNPTQSERALATLLADQPARMDVRLVLAQVQMGNKQAKDAIETLGIVKKVTPADAPRFFQLLAFANMEVGNRSLARANAQRWLENTQDTEEKTSANRLIHYLDEPNSASARPAVAQPLAPPQLSDESGTRRPTLARPEPPPGSNAERTTATPELPSISGTLVELDCKGPKPKFVLQTAGGRVFLLMDDPKNVLISGVPEGTVDMNCGPQKQVAVRIQYDPPTASSPGVMGLVRAIHYEPDSAKLKDR